MIKFKSKNHNAYITFFISILQQQAYINVFEKLFFADFEN